MILVGNPSVSTQTSLTDLKLTACNLPKSLIFIAGSISRNETGRTTVSYTFHINNRTSNETEFV